jgi:tetratricopeptide (TPR) repeat protein
MKRATVWTVVMAVVVCVRFVAADSTLDRLMEAGKYDEAIEHAEENLPTSDRTADEWAQIGRAYEEKGLEPKALATYMVSMRSNPDHYASVLGAARVSNTLEKYERAMDLAKQAMDIKFSGEASWQYAKACIELDKPEQAKSALEKVIETDPENIVANRELGNIYYEDEEYDKALPLLQKAYDNSKDNHTALKLGRCYRLTGQAQEAIEYFKKAAQESDIVHEAQLELARAYFRAGNYKEAVSYYDKCIDKAADADAQDYFKRAMATEKTEGKSKAISAYKQAIKQFGNDKSNDALTARAKVARYQLEQEEYRGALGHLLFIKEADTKATQVTDLYMLLAEAQMNTDKNEEAIASLEKAIDINNRNLKAYAALARLYKESGMEDEAKKTYEKMINLSPGDPKVYLTLGEYNLEAEEYQKALDNFSKSDSLEKSPEAWQGIALSAYKLNRVQTAIDAAQKAVKADPDKVQAYEVLYKAYLDQDDYASAIEPLESLVEKQPRKETYWQELALCYKRTDQEDKLAEADKHIIELDKKNTTSRQRYADYLYRKEKLEEAYDIYQQLASLDADNAEVFDRLYRIALELEKDEDAFKYVLKYISLEPDDDTRHAQAQATLGNVLYDKGRKDDALEAYRKAIELDPNVSGFYSQYAEIVIDKGKHDEAIKAINGKIEAGQATANDYKTLGTIYKKMEQYDKAIDAFNKSLQKDPQNVTVLTLLAQSQEQLGRTDEAVITYEQIVMMKSDVKEQFKSLGDLYMKQDQKGQAVDAYKKFLDNGGRDNEVAKEVGLYAYENENYEDAVTYLSMVGGELADDFMVRRSLADASFQTGKHEEAVRIAKGLLDRNPSLSSLKMLYMIVAKSYEKMEQNTNAAEFYRKYTRLKGVRDKDAAFKSANLLEKEDTETAIARYKENTGNYPDDYRNFLRLGMLYSQKEQMDEAVSYFKRITSMADSIPVIWEKLAQAYHTMGNTEEELQAYKNYVEHKPQDKDANKRIGQILVEKRDYNDALIYLETASTVAPKDPEILRAKASAYRNTGNTGEAIKALQKAKEVRPEDAELRQKLVDMYLAEGKMREAVDEVEEMTEKFPQNNDIRLTYARLLYKQDKLKKAYEETENLMATAPSADVLMLQGHILAAQKKYEEAVQSYDEVIQMEDSPRAYYYKAEIYREYGRKLNKSPMWAKTYYERALSRDSTYALAELGLAKLQLLWDKKELYMKHLERAYELDPDNPKIREEWEKAN